MEYCHHSNIFPPRGSQITKKPALGCHIPSNDTKACKPSYERFSHTREAPEKNNLLQGFLLEIRTEYRSRGSSHTPIRSPMLPNFQQSSSGFCSLFMLGTCLIAILTENALFHLVFIEDKAWSLMTGLLVAWTFTSMHIAAKVHCTASTCEKLGTTCCKSSQPVEARGVNWHRGE